MDFKTGSYSFTELDPKDVEVGKYTAIAKDCHFHGSDNHISVIERQRVSNNLDHSGHSKGKIIVGNDVWICEGVRVLSGVTIGSGAIVGAGAVVARNIPAYAIVCGNPVKAYIYRSRFEIPQIEKLLKISWWDWADEKVKQANKAGHFHDITKFLELYG